MLVLWVAMYRQLLLVTILVIQYIDWGVAKFGMIDSEKKLLIAIVK